MIDETEQYHYPLAGRWPVSQTYAEHVERAKQYPPGRYNGGIDYACPTGTAVLATLPGRVMLTARDKGGYGTVIKLSHGEINGVHVESLYAHLSEMRVNVGVYVDRGAQIGWSGNTGNSTGPHLHFEVRHDGIPVDPQPLLDDVLTELPVEINQVRIRQQMNLRAGTSTDDDVIGRLDAGAVVDVLDVLTNGRDRWAMVCGYVALEYNGTRFAEVVE